MNTDVAHRELVDNLAQCLPVDCQPIILLDVIFKTPWFKAVEEKGWYWVGRGRGNVQLSTDKRIWKRCNRWFDNATTRAKKLREVYYSKSTQFPWQAVLYRGVNKGRIKKKKHGGKSQCTTDKYQQQKAKEPRLLVFNLPASLKATAKKVVNMYRQRMQIEENFRDTKNSKLGISLEYANSRSAERFLNLLLIAAIILYVLWCFGYASDQLNQQRLLQVNTERKRRVLSYIYIGREVVDDHRYCLDEPLLIYVFSQLSELSINYDDLK